jgi:hypothetical protein
VRVLDYRSSAENIYNARDWGCKGDGATDDTACLTAFFTFLNTKTQGVAYLPSGKYLMNGTLRLNSALWTRGDGYQQSFIVETNPTADLFVLDAQVQSASGFPAGPVISDISFAGEGPITTGNLLINAVNGRAVFQNIGFWGHGGRGILIESERGFYSNLHFDSVRQAISTTPNIAINESYLRDFTIMSPGLASNDLQVGPFSNYCYNVNSNSSGVFPSSGQIQQDPHFTIDLNANITNFSITNGSIKPTQCIGGIRVRSSNVMSIEHVYFEGFVSGAINPSISYGGAHEKSPLTSTITATQTTFDIKDGKWFSPFVGSATDLQAAEAIMIIRPPDYVPGSTTASSLGNGITQGTFEYVSFQGIVHDASTTGWHVVVGSRGASSTTAIAWPAGAIFEEGWGTQADPMTIPYPGAIRLVDNHFNSAEQANGYTLVCNPDNEQTCGEVVVGVEPDAFFVPGSGNFRGYGVGLRFDGTAQMFCGSAPMGLIDTYYDATIDARGIAGSFPLIDAGGNLGSSTSLNASVIGGCSIVRHVFANGFGTTLHYMDAGTDIHTGGPSWNGWRGYSLSSSNAQTANQPTMFIPVGNTFHVSSYGSATPFPSDWALDTGLRQNNNGTALFAVDSSGNISTPGSGTAARLIVGVKKLAFSATPQFDVSTGDQFITLTGNVTSSTLVNLAAGQRVTFKVCQDATGGRTFAWPTAAHGTTTISSGANTCTVQQFESFDGSTLNATGPGVPNQ